MSRSLAQTKARIRDAETAAFKRGAEAMREEAARTARKAWMNADRSVPENAVINQIESAIRALPLPSPPALAPRQEDQKPNRDEALAIAQRYEASALRQDRLAGQAIPLEAAQDHWFHSRRFRAIAARIRSDAGLPPYELPDAGGDDQAHRQRAVIVNPTTTR